jgi:chromosomal replication initiator protein
MNEAAGVWGDVATAVQDQVSEAVWLSSFHSCVPDDIRHGRLILRVPSHHIKERIENRYAALVRDALIEVGRPELDLQLDVDPSLAELPALDDLLPAEPVIAAPLRDVATSNAPSRSGTSLNPRYTFDTFVRGPSNRFAFAAAERVAETPAKSYNPLFIYGAAGLGKTHLLHAIAHYVGAHYAHHQVCYVSTEQFLNEYIEAIRTSTTSAFKRRYREVDVLLIDDIQFMENKEGLQEEFFHTFNSLHGANRQIIISSDRNPDSIATLEDRLRSRFKWGLITDIQPPDIETRMAILRNKAERDQVDLPNEVMEFIATHVTHNIRELEGALIRISAFASLSGSKGALNVDLARSVLSDLINDSSNEPITPRRIFTTVCAYFDLPASELTGKSRTRPLVEARQIAMYLFRELTDLSYPAIAREFGGRDHTTVIHAVEKITALMKERQQIFDRVSELIQRIKSTP